MKRLFRLLLYGVIPVLLVAVLVASQLDMLNDPTVVARVESEAVVLVPSEAVDLAERARLGARPGMEMADGIAFDSIWIDTLDFAADTTRLDVPAEIRGQASATGGALFRPYVLQAFAVTRGCRVHLERQGAGVTRFAVTTERTLAPADDGLATTSAGDDDRLDRCRVRGRVLLHRRASGEGAQTRSMELIEFRDEVDVGAASLFVQRADPFRLFRVPLAGLRFETEEADAHLQTAVLGGEVRIPRPRNVRETLFNGDTLILGSVSGQAVEIVVSDTIETMFKGSASNPVIRPGRGSLTPTLLEELADDRVWALVLAAVVALTSLWLAAADIYLADD